MMDKARMVLSDLCDFVALQVDPQDRPYDLYVGLEHIESARFERIGVGRASDVRSAKYAFQPGDVLYGKLRPYLDKAVLARDAGICTTELLVLRPKEGVDPRFLVSVLHSRDFVEHAVAGTTGVQHPRTSWNHVSDFELPHFESDEQTTIANLVWGVHTAITGTESAINAGADLKRGVMGALFARGLRREAPKDTEIGVVPESWLVEPLGARHAVVSGGTPSRAIPAYWQGGKIPWVKTTEIAYCVIRETEEHITEAGLAGSAAKMLPAGTILLAMYGQGVTRGKVAILGVEASCNQACAAVMSTDDTVDTKYLYHFLTYRYEEIRQLAHGGQQQNLNLDIVRDLRIAFPSDKNEQHSIAAILDTIDDKIDVHRRKRSLLEELFQTLLHKLITGAFGVVDLDFAALEPEHPQEVAI